jgi:hypothetical protein
MKSKIFRDGKTINIVDGDPQYNRAEVRDYLHKCIRFLQRLMIIVHTLGGQPARSSELMSLRYANTQYDGADGGIGSRQSKVTVH